MAIYPLIMFVELLLYFIAMTMVSIRLFGARCHWRRLVVFFVPLFAALLAVELTGNTAVANVVSFLFFVPVSILLKLCLLPIRYRTVLSEYLTLYTVNILLSSALLSVIPTNDIGGWLMELAVHIFMLSICVLACYGQRQRKVQMLFEWTPKSTKRILLTKLVCDAFLSTVVLHYPLVTEPVLSNALKLIFILLLVMDGLIISVLLVYTATNKHIRSVAEQYEEQIQAQSDYYQKLSESDVELRRFRHDYRNLSIGLEKLLSEGKTEEALRMLRHGQQEQRRRPRYESGSGIVNALMEDKALRADTIHTTITFEGAVPSDRIEAADLCVIFGNTLDNALEACEKLPPEEEKTILVQCLCRSGMMFMEMTNPVKEPVAIGSGLPQTTKSNKKDHGLGLYSLEKIIKKYDGTLICTCVDRQFTISISLYLPPSSAAPA